LARRQPGEAEQAVAGFLQAIGDGAMLEPPFADESLAAGLDLLRRRRVDHVGVVGGDFVVQAFGCMGQKVPVLVNRASLDWDAVPNGGN
jgi:hypothetical protein